ncbi:MAG: hypothetical protein K6F00_09270, partial [Lachnospiraceae bacterium]|nr:hypothetical protein [Lachnospiraceae bacterium]
MIIYNSLDKENRMNNPSKGNQPKINIGDSWYKLDFLGYEGASEFVTSELLKHSNVKSFVEYRIEDVEYNDSSKKACISRNFLKEGQEIVTVEQMFKKLLGKPSSFVFKDMSVKDRIKYTVDFVEKSTGLNNFGEYLTTLLELDAIILNEDRHLHNIAVIENSDGSFSYCPIFDNGAAFFSDMNQDYPLSKTFGRCLKSVKAKPFSSSFDKQAKEAESLYGEQLEFEKGFTLPEDVIT